MAYYQLHHKRRHLQIYDLDCETCGLGFWTRRQLESHRCLRDRRDINTRRRQILAARAKDKLRDAAAPYFAATNCTVETAPEHVSLTQQSTCDDGSDSHVVTSLSEAQPQQSLSSAVCITDSSQYDITDYQFTEPMEAGIVSRSESDNVEESRSTVKSESSDGPVNGCAESQANSKQWPMATATSHGKLICDVCSKEITVRNYHPHMRRVHDIESNKKRPICWKVCEQCGYRCQDNYKFRRHQMTHGMFLPGCVVYFC
jgi:hypothetical protein